MHNYTFRPVEVARIVGAELGVTIDPDFEPVLLFSNNISDLEGQPPLKNYWYFGDFVIAGYDQFLSSASIQNTGTLAGYVDTLNINAPGGLSTNKNVFRGVLWNQVASWQNITGHFYGYKLNRARGWVEQVANLTPGAGWTNAGTSYTHVSGTTEQIYLGAWTVSSTLRVTITFSGITTGNVRLQMDNSGTFATITANGTYTFEVTTNGSDGALFIVPSNTFNGTYDNATFIVEKLDYI